MTVYIKIKVKTVMDHNKYRIIQGVVVRPLKLSDFLSVAGSYRRRKHLTNI